MPDVQRSRGIGAYKLDQHPPPLPEIGAPVGLSRSIDLLQGPQPIVFPEVEIDETRSGDFAPRDDPVQIGNVIDERLGDLPGGPLHRAREDHGQVGCKIAEAGIFRYVELDGRDRLDGKTPVPACSIQGIVQQVRQCLFQ